MPLTRQTSSTKTNADNYLLPYGWVSPATMRGGKGERKSDTLSLCFHTTSIFKHHSSIFVLTNMFAQVEIMYKWRTMVPLTAKSIKFLKSETVYSSAWECCWTTPTWQGNSQFSDLEEGRRKTFMSGKRPKHNRNSTQGNGSRWNQETSAPLEQTTLRLFPVGLWKHIWPGGPPPDLKNSCIHIWRSLWPTLPDVQIGFIVQILVIPPH